MGNDTSIAAYNPPVNFPAIIPPPKLQMETSDSILRLNLGAPAPPSNNPSPDVTAAYVLPARVLDLEAVPLTWAELTSEPRDAPEVRQSVAGAFDLKPERSALQGAKNEDLDVVLAPALEITLEPCPPVFQPTNPVVIKSRCAPCRFSGVSTNMCYLLIPWLISELN